MKHWLYISWSNLKQWMCLRFSLHSTFKLAVHMQLSALKLRFDLKENGDSSVGRVADWKANRSTDAGSSPRYGKGFLSPRVNFQRRLQEITASVQLPRVVTYINICACVKDCKHWQPTPPPPPPTTSPESEAGDVFLLLIDDRLCSAILRSLEQTHCARMWFYVSD